MTAVFVDKLARDSLLHDLFHLQGRHSRGDHVAGVQISHGCGHLPEALPGCRDCGDPFPSTPHCLVRLWLMWPRASQFTHLSGFFVGWPVAPLRGHAESLPDRDTQAVLTHAT
jgi:hypothetical protein